MDVYGASSILILIIMDDVFISFATQTEEITRQRKLRKILECMACLSSGGNMFFGFVIDLLLFNCIHVCRCGASSRLGFFDAL